MDQMDGPVAGSVAGTELHFDLDASKVEVGYLVWFSIRAVQYGPKVIS